MNQQTKTKNDSGNSPMTPTQNSLQRTTLKSTASLQGVGLFTAAKTSLNIEPAPVGQGITFQRTDLEHAAPIPARISHVRPSPRRTTIGLNDASVQTVEHLLAACAGLGITDAAIKVDGPEVPIMDGSALPFAQAILDAGIKPFQETIDPIQVKNAVTAASRDAVISAIPTDDPSQSPAIRYTLDYEDNPHVLPSTVAFTINQETFLNEIAPARTFSTRPEAEAARAQGMFTHLEPKDMLVLEHGKPVDNQLRFQDEPARHKVLDVLGDLALIGAPLAARVVASRSGHALHHDLASRILSSHQADAFANSIKDPELDIDQVLQILPHRYPFILVDRVLEINAGQNATGIKNVTINEPFFQGHYPSSPIMPGVLIVEAMCQLAGLMLHETLDHDGKVALLLSMDGIRWRKPVRPGDQLILRSTQIKGSARAAEVSCTAHVQEALVAEVHAKFLLTPPPASA